MAKDKYNKPCCVKTGRFLSMVTREMAAIKQYYGFESSLIQQDGMYYFTMPYFPGKTLKQALLDGLSIYEKLVIADKLNQQLQRLLDQDLLHRDLKSDCIMVDIKGGNIDVNIIDLGSTVNLNKDNPKILHSLRSHIAPEYSYGGEIGKHSDIYSYGKVFLQLFPEHKHLFKNFIGKDYKTRMSSFENTQLIMRDIFVDFLKIVKKDCNELVENLKKKEEPKSGEIIVSLERMQTKLDAIRILDKSSLKDLSDDCKQIYKKFTTLEKSDQKKFFALIDSLYQILVLFGWVKNPKTNLKNIEDLSKYYEQQFQSLTDFDLSLKESSSDKDEGSDIGNDDILNIF